MSVKGVLKFDTIAVATVNADFTKAAISLEGKAAFIDSDTKETHGWTTGRGGIWSKETLIKLQELRTAMENDLASLHFSKGTVPSNGARKEHGLDFPSGIGEHVGVEPPSV